ncbi:hypothetical protein MKEN_00836900 [Mycena kentingensis (nom. inval.)]|nr:hypothetical protein MKEN_00836900 [Mycena kentingensis (nom. inval.)]
MHRCLQVAEVSLEIVSQVGEADEKTLAILARSCRAFSEPALDVLWRHGTPVTIVHLLRCLPAEALVWHGNDLRLAGPLLRADMERLQRYANRIRHYVHGPWSMSPRYRSSVSLIAMFLPREVLCSRLQSLTWYSDDDGTGGAAFRLFLSPRLNNLFLFAPSHVSTTLFPLIQRHNLPLATVRINGENDETASCTALAEFVRSLDRVKNLSIPTLDGDLLVYLSTHERVTSITTWSLLPDFSVATLDKHNAFAHLTSFQATQADIVALLRLVQALSIAELSSVCFSATDSATTAQVATFLQEVSRHWNTTLTSFSFSEYGESAWVLHRDSFLCLGLFPLLTKLELTLPSISAAQFGDDTLEILTFKCRWLQHFALNQYAAETNFTLGCLTSFARNCPVLAFLEITVDGTAVPDLPAEFGSELDGRRAHWQWFLLEFAFGCSKITDPFAVAAFLTGLFPRLTGVFKTWEDGGDEEYDIGDQEKQWREVRALIPRLKKIREQERGWTRAEAQEIERQLLDEERMDVYELEEGVRGIWVKGKEQ